MDGNQTQEVDSLSWWMNKEPLRSNKLGQGNGKTAAEIFKEEGIEDLIVSHETNSFIAYDNITRSSKGRANAFISRDGVTGEAAVFGNGFYTRIGREGAAGTGITIRFKLNPKAREGTDFTYSGSYIVFKNKNALTLIQENLNISLLDFIRLSLQGEITTEDKGLIAKLERKFERKTKVSKEETQEIVELLANATIDEVSHQGFIALSKSLPDTFDQIFGNLIKKGKSDDYIISTFFEDPSLPSLDKWILYYIELGRDNLLMRKISPTSLSNFSTSPDVLFKLAQNPKNLNPIIAKALSQREWYPAGKKALDFFVSMEDQRIDRLLIKYVLNKDFIEGRDEILETMLSRSTEETQIALLKHVFSKDPESSNKVEGILEALISKNKPAIDIALTKSVFNKKFWAEREDLVYKILKRSTIEVKYSLLEFVFSKHFFPIKETAVDQLLKLNDQKINELLITKVLTVKQITKKERWIDKFIALNDPNLDRLIIEDTVVDKRWGKKRFLWIETILNRGTADEELIYHVLNDEQFKDFPMWVETLLRRGKFNKELANSVVTQPHWKNHPEWISGIFEYFSTEHLWIPDASFWLTNPSLTQRLVDEGTPAITVFKEIISEHADWRLFPDITENTLNELEEVTQTANYIGSITASNFFEIKMYDRPEWLVKILLSVEGQADWAITHGMSEDTRWAQHPVLQRYTGETNVKPESIVARSKKVDFFSWYQQDQIKNPLLQCRGLLN